MGNNGSRARTTGSRARTTGPRARKTTRRPAATAPAEIAAAIRAKARSLGFAAVGIAHRDAIAPQAKRVAKFLAEQRHGTMQWMERAERTEPATMFPAARSVIAVGVNAGPAGDPLAVLG